MSEKAHQEIFSFHEWDSTEELLEIWIKNDRTIWADETFDVLQELLHRRIGELPPQNEPVVELTESDLDEIPPEEFTEPPMADGKPWPWYRIWINAFLFPNEETWSKFKSVGNSAFRQALTWMILACFSPYLFTGLYYWIKGSIPIGLISLINLFVNYIPHAIMNLVFSVFLIHVSSLLIKFFRGRGDFMIYFILYAAISTIFIYINTLAEFLRLIYPSDIFIFLTFIIYVYCLLIVPAKAIKIIFHFNLVGAFFINLFAFVIIFLFESFLLPPISENTAITIIALLTVIQVWYRYPVFN